MRSAYLKMTVATMLFGSYLVASKLILKEAPVFTATLVRLDNVVTRYATRWRGSESARRRRMRRRFSRSVWRCPAIA